MASRLFTASLTPLRTPLLPLVLGLGSATCLHYHLHMRRPVLLDSASSSLFSRPAIGSSSQVPVLRQGKLNPRAVRQISMGSILGVLAGLGVSVFSKPLAVILGLLVVGVQWAESYGIHVVPYNRIQRYVKGIDIKSSLEENVPFKISFGVLFALVGFAEFSNDI